MTAKPNFTLFRFPNVSNQAAGIGEYVGMLVLDDRAYTIEASVLDYTKPDGTRGKYFSGRVLGGQAVARTMFRGATMQGEPPPDLVTMMEATDFDDWAQWKWEPQVPPEAPADGTSPAEKPDMPK
jgi:hypothetical protein